MKPGGRSEAYISLEFQSLWFDTVKAGSIAVDCVMPDYKSSKAQV